MTLVGYARVSTADQSLDLQLDKLTAAGCEKIFSEQRSGATAKDRDQLQALIEYVRPGDLVLVTKLDRLGRSVADVLATVEALTERKGAALRVLDQHGIDTTTSTGRLMFQLLAAVAEFERAILRERQLEGIARAKAKGRYRKGGRPKVDDAAILAALAGRWETPTSVARRLKIGRTTVYRVIERQKAAEAAKRAATDQIDIEDITGPPERLR